jgi:hypothetical protein
LSAYDAEPAGPSDLFTRRELDLEKSHRLKFAGTVQPAGVDSFNTTCLDSLDKGRLRIGVIARHQHCGRIRAHLPCAERAREGGIERFEHMRGRQRCRKYRSGGAICGTTSESKVSRFTGLVMSTTVLPANLSAYFARMSCKAAW